MGCVWECWGYKSEESGVSHTEGSTKARGWLGLEIGVSCGEDRIGGPRPG